jgi:hypothetical protein
MCAFEHLAGLQGTSLEGKEGFDEHDMQVRADQIRTLKPTGNPIDDASEMRRILFHNQGKTFERTLRGALREGVIEYMLLEQVARDGRDSETIRLVHRAKVECVERFLTYYKVESRHLQEFESEFPDDNR